MITPFTIASTPQVVFGVGKVASVPTLVQAYGSRVLLVTGSGSFLNSVHGKSLLEKLHEQKVVVEVVQIPAEPTPQMVDAAVSKHSSISPAVVLAIGGGSALDAGKAISAMLPLNAPVKDYLEGVGTRNHPGSKVPFIAVPTTSGTGSEATKNSVLSETGPAGYKKSLRHNRFVPDVAILDPALTLSCPAQTTAASGMDAFTQLLESYLSTNANPITDSLALEGLSRIAKSLVTAYHDGSNIEARTGMLLAAYLSGITLANAGLGLVHGFASSIGGYYEIPHGVICSSIMASANRVTVRKLRSTGQHPGALEKYHRVGMIFSSLRNKAYDYYIDFLLDLIAQHTHELNIPSLGKYGVTKSDTSRIVGATDNKYNPIALDAVEMSEVLETSM